MDKNEQGRNGEKGMKSTMETGVREQGEKAGVKAACGEGRER